MTALTETYIEELANGRVPKLNSPERLAYEAEMMEGYDYTWAIQEFQRIKETVESDIWEEYVQSGMGA